MVHALNIGTLTPGSGHCTPEVHTDGINTMIYPSGIVPVLCTSPPDYMWYLLSRVCPAMEPVGQECLLRSAPYGSVRIPVVHTP